jgi:hypothetical protein
MGWRTRRSPPPLPDGLVDEAGRGIVRLAADGPRRPADAGGSMDQQRRSGYRTLVAEVSDSIHLRRFCRTPSNPGHSNIKLGQQEARPRKHGR